MIIGFAGCVAVVSTAVDELNKEQARHAISSEQFDAVQLGSTEQEVIAQLGKQPENAQNFVSKGVLDESEIRSSCIYYNKKGGTFGDRYQLCFDGDSLRSKNEY
jgi:hypothetical protein